MIINSLLARYIKYYLFFVVIFSAGGVSVFKHLTNQYFIFLIVSIILYLRFPVKLLSFFKLLIPWFVFTLINIFKFNEFHSLFFIMVPTSFFGIWLCCNLIKNKEILFSIIEQVILKLSKISFFFYLWHFLNWNSLKIFMSFFDLNTGKSYNNLFYTAHFRSFDNFLPQNSGFAWEPGVFAIFILFALCIRFLNNNFSVDKYLILYIIILITTQTTTGYLGLIIFISYYVYIRNLNRFILYLPFLFLFSYYVFNNSALLSYKIFDQINIAEAEFNFYSKHGSESSTSIGRFSGLLLNFEDFKRNPLFGYGGHFAETLSWRKGLGINSTSGLGNSFAQYGLFGFFFIIYFFYKSSTLYNYRFSTILIFLIFLVSAFSFSIVFRPFFLLFFFSNYIFRFIDYD